MKHPDRRQGEPGFVIYYMMSQPASPDTRTYYQLILQKDNCEVHNTDLEDTESYAMLSGRFTLICETGAERSILWNGATRPHDSPLPYLVNEEGERIEDIVAIARSTEGLEHAYFNGCRSVVLALRLMELDFEYQSLIIPDPNVQLLVTA